MTEQPDPFPMFAGIAAANTRELILALVKLGIPGEAVLSGIIGEALRTFAEDQGWPETAKLCEELTRQARTLAPPGAFALARAEAAGRA
jgi:hypothetical protein